MKTRSRFWILASTSKFRRWTSHHGIQVVGTSPAARIEYTRVNFRKPTVLFMGDERKGLSSSDRDLCSVLVRIPMVGKSDSLNIGVATGIMLYEVFRFRGKEKRGKRWV